MKAIKKIMIVAGEESGDMYASNIINKLSYKEHLHFYGMGSSRMKNTKATIILDSSDLSVMGFFEILKVHIKINL